MSVHVSSWAWQQKVGDPEAKLVLLKLADQANDEGVSWPSRSTIAEACETSVSTVRRRLGYLVDKKLLIVEARKAPASGLKTSNRYTIPYRGFPDGSSMNRPEPTDGSDIGEPTVGSDMGEPIVGSRRVSHEPSVEASSESSLNREQATRIYSKLELERQERNIAEAEELLDPQGIAATKEENKQMLAKMRSELGL